MADLTATKSGLADELNHLLVMESRSLARHIDEAKPYLSPQTHHIWAQTQRVAHMSSDHEQRLGAIIDRLGLPFRPGTFQSEVASYHFIDLQTMLELLIGEKRQQIASYERAKGHAANMPELLTELDDLLADTQGQLALFESQAKES